MIYVAYGSNLNIEQMEIRCPGAALIGTGYLKDWELIYRGSKTGAYATIRKHKGKIVPVGLWRITRRHERALDRYEGYPIFYRKYLISVYGNKDVTEGMVYIMEPGRPIGRPSGQYIDTVYHGYMACGLDGRFLLESLITNKKELKKRRG